MSTETPNVGPNNPDNPESLASNVVLACALSPVFAVIFVVLRFYTAHKILRTIHADDWLILAALILSIGYSVSIIFLTKHGLGYHLAYIHGPHVGLLNLREFMLISVVPVAILGNMATLFIKASILRFYLRFSTSCRLNLVVYIVLTLVIAANTLGAFSFLFSCRPIRYQWDYYTMGGQATCLKMDPWYGWLVIFNWVTDGVLLVLPAWIIWPLRISFAQKVALAAILGMGGFVLGVSILRFAIVAGGWGDPDMTYKFATNYIWSIIEINVGIVCASAPCLRALLGRRVPSVVRIGEDDTVELYTIPVSQVAARLSEGPPGTRDKEKGSSTATGPSGSWRSKFCRSDASSIGEERV